MCTYTYLDYSYVIDLKTEITAVNISQLWQNKNKEINKKPDRLKQEQAMKKNC